MSENNGDWNFLFNPPSDEPYCLIAVLSATIQYAGARFIKDLNAFFQRENERDVMRPKEKKHLNFL